MKISVIGVGYVGLVSGAIFAEKGHDVLCVDSDQTKIDNLLQGKIPIYEPGLDKLVEDNVASKRLSFGNTVKEAVDFGEVVFIAVGTPSREDGSADLSYVENVAREIAKDLKEYRVIVDKSTVPVETGEWVAKTIKYNNEHGVDFDVVSNPEFLREGSALEDALNPDRIVVGASSKKAFDKMKEVYKPWKDSKIIYTDVKSAEIIKHASNSFLATKISFINAIARICEVTGADINMVAEGMRYDKRIGKHFLNAGIGYGGSCFPKDVSAFIWIAEQFGYDFKLLKTIEEINEGQWMHFYKKIEDALWVLKDKTIGVLGLSFKPDTDDLRNAPALKIIEKLKSEGVKIKAYDPVSMDKAKEIMPDIEYVSSIEKAVANTNAVLLVTEWQEFKDMDLKKVKSLMTDPILIDGRNVFDPAEMKELGFRYFSIGRGLGDIVKELEKQTSATIN